MKKLFLVLFILLSLHFSLDGKNAQPNYTLSAVCIFYNEADYLKEWIEFHRIVGIEHFYLYNNNSNDNYLTILEPYIAQGIVELTNWPSSPEKDWSRSQVLAYDHCVKKNKNNSQWLAFFDVDEFIVPVENQTIPEFLSNYEQYGGVNLFWQNYGTSYLSSIPKEKLLIESLTLKYPWDYEKNLWVKTIAQPKKIEKCYIHTMSYKKGHYAVTPNFNKKKGIEPEIDKIRINHYWTRAEDFFYTVKIPRVERYTHKEFTQEQIDKILFESNQVEDLAIFPYITEVRKALNQ